MHDRYFGCKDCKVFLDAGGKLAFWALEEAGVVRAGEPISVTDVLSAERYWSPEGGQHARWLYEEVLPSVRSFLEEHKDHCVVCDDDENFLPRLDADSYFDWMQVGYLAQPTPRYFVERLGFTRWAQVCEFMSKAARWAWWWLVDDDRERARTKFDELVTAKKCS